MTDKPAPKPPGRVQAGAIVKRYLKPEIVEKGLSRADWAREMPTLYELWKQYPSLAFWTKHEVGFALNSLLWFKTPEGAARLKSDWAVFHLVLDPPEGDSAPVLEPESVDKTAASNDYPITTTQRAPRTVAEFLRG